MTVTTATRVMTAECAACEACTKRRSVARPANIYAYNTDAWWDAQDAAAELDCHCDHDTCATLEPGHDTDECEWCVHRYDVDEDYYRDR